MCGIIGFISKKNKINNEELTFVSNGLKDINHRGPDFSSIENYDRVSFGHVRLAILDLDPRSNQPMLSHDNRYSIIFNGEIYNWIEIKTELEKKGISFKTKSDTEVILQGYIYYGISILEKLRGMFAFSIYDRVKNETLIARDPVGKKPLYYSETVNGLAFCSEIKPILYLASVNKSYDVDALTTYMIRNIRHIPEPNTLYQGIKKLRPGHYMKLQNGSVLSYERYWFPKFIQTDLNEKDVYDKLYECVDLRMRADVPVGALLSGGVDSSAIVSMMASSKPGTIKTYALGMNAHDEDILRARKVAKHFGLEHKEYFFDPDEQLELLKNTIHSYGEPIALLPIIHARVLCRHIKSDGIKVVMNGNGADELFYGYNGHHQTAKITKLANYLDCLQPGFNFLSKFIQHPALSILGSERGYKKSALLNNYRDHSLKKFFNQNVIDGTVNYLEAEWNDLAKLGGFRDYIDESNFCALISENSHSLATIGDLPAMLESIEMRSPFLDQELIELAYSVNYKSKVTKKPMKLKKILRDAVSPIIPLEIINAPKRGFGHGIQEKDVINSMITPQDINDVKDKFSSIFKDDFDFNSLNPTEKLKLGILNFL